MACVVLVLSEGLFGEGLGLFDLVVVDLLWWRRW